MSMLAGPRRKQKVVNLRAKNSAWSNDNNKFGQRMLEKMGWSTGKGLGANENGIVEHVVARYKNDDKGLGYEDKNDQWTKHDDDFNALLANLSNGSEQEKLHSGVSLEHKSKKSKARVHYHKFTRGKDLSRYSEKDLANIFGKKSFEEKTEINVLSESIKEDIITTEQVFTEKGSMEDYFKNKLANFKSKNNIHLNLNNEECINEDEEADYGFKGFSSALDDSQTTQNGGIQSFSFYNNSGNMKKEVIDNIPIESDDEVKGKHKCNSIEIINENEKRKSKKRKKEKSTANSSVELNVMQNDDYIVEENMQTAEIPKKKKKKSKKVNEINVEIDTNLNHTNTVLDNTEIDLCSEVKYTKESKMVIHDKDEVHNEVSVMKKSDILESKKYIIVKNHVREVHNNVEEIKILDDIVENHSNITLKSSDEVSKMSKKTNHLRNTCDNLESVSTSASEICESDIEELRTVYEKCKEVVNKIETKYGHLLNLDRIPLKVRKRQNLPSSTDEECNCNLNKKIVFDDDGHGVTQNMETDYHICSKKLMKDIHDFRRENVNKELLNYDNMDNVKIEYEQITEFPDDLQSLNNILRNPKTDIQDRNKVIEKVKLIRQDYVNEIRFNKHSLIEQVKNNPDEIFVFNGSNLSELPGYLSQHLI